jgi:processive 1,2-diacylglycerol beta-glucosyltransferase
MVKNILIISSDYTGHGHKSITDSFKEQFAKHPEVNIQVVDGFLLGGKALLRIGKLYGSVTRNAKDLWKLVWDISLKKPSLMSEITLAVIRDNFIKLLRNTKPDVILSVHPNFNSPILSILEEYKIKIPFITFIADLVSITPLWADRRADYIICPTKESMYKCIEFGVSESKLKVLGFPVRSKFCNLSSETLAQKDYAFNRPLECLIMSGGEGSGNMSRVARILLKNFNCKVSIITGRNSTLKRRLEKTLLEEYGEKVELFGFVENIQDLMYKSDIAFTRGSPNVMMEAIVCNTPLIITGALPGQEEGNPDYIKKNKLGVICKDMKKLKGVVGDLLSDNAEKLNQIKRSQRDFRNPDAAKNIVEFILSIEKTEEATNTETSRNFTHFINPRKFRLKL